MREREGETTMHNKDLPVAGIGFGVESSVLWQDGKDVRRAPSVGSAPILVLLDGNKPPQPLQNGHVVFFF